MIDLNPPPKRGRVRERSVTGVRDVERQCPLALEAKRIGLRTKARLEMLK